MMENFPILDIVDKVIVIEMGFVLGMLEPLVKNVIEIGDENRR